MMPTEAELYATVRRLLAELGASMTDMAKVALQGTEKQRRTTALGWLERAEVVGLLEQSVPDKQVVRLEWRLVPRKKDEQERDS
jgi:hypothetical protein